jgi:hypothetical protein
MSEPEQGGRGPQTETNDSPLQSALNDQLRDLTDQLPDTVRQNGGDAWADKGNGWQAVQGHDSNPQQLEAARAGVRAAAIRDIPTPHGPAPEAAHRPEQISSTVSPDLNLQQIATAGSRFNQADERLATPPEIDAAANHTTAREPLMRRALGRLKRLGAKGKHHRP